MGSGLQKARRIYYSTTADDMDPALPIIIITLIIIIVIVNIIIAIKLCRAFISSTVAVQKSESALTPNRFRV